jgi:hypothetical protein
MKKATLSRILGLALALVLALSTSVAFALPSGTSAIEGLPEMPTVPTMVTSAKGYDVTITLSEKLNWLNFVQNWQWLPINFSEDGLTGTYSTKDLSTQPGYGTWNDSSVTKTSDWLYWLDAEDKGDDWSWEVENKNPATGWEGSGVHREYAYGPGYYIQVPTSIYVYRTYDWDGNPIAWYDYNYTDDYILSESEDEDLEETLWEKIYIAKAALIKRYTDLGDEDALNYLYNDVVGFVEFKADGIVRDYDFNYSHSYGNYRLTTGGAQGKAIADFAYDGEAADGSHVKYGRYGECLQISTTLTGVNFLGTDKTPVKTTVSWTPLEHYGKRVWNWYIYEIVEEYEDGTKLEAHFSSSKGGKLLGTKTIAAE